MVISPDSLEEHRRYAINLFREEQPYLYVSDPTGDIARCYGLLRREEHPHGGFYYRSLWIVSQEGMITHKSLPWTANLHVEEYQKLFLLIGSEPGEWITVCGPA